MTTRLLLLLSFTLTLPALEVIGEPAWLTKTITPSWRQVKLGEVLDAIGTAAGCPVKRDKDLADAEQGHQVTIILPQPTTVRRVLEALEKTQDLIITAEAQQMTAVPYATWRVTSRRMITFDLRDYGALIAFPEPDPTDRQRQVPTAIDPAAGQGQPYIVEAYKPDAEATVEYLRNCIERGDDPPTLRLSEHHLLLATVNPHEEAQVRSELTRLAKLTTQTSTWTATFGVLAADQPLATGLVSHEVADAVRKRLSTRKQFHVQTTDQRIVRAADQRKQDVMTRVDRLRDSLLPTPEVLTTGWSCELRPIAGRGRQRVTYHLSWSEARPGATSALIVPPIPSDPAADQRAGGDQTLTLVKPAVWSWEPAGDVFLPDHHALVLVAPHADGRAVIVVERVP